MADGLRARAKRKQSYYEEEGEDDEDLEEAAEFDTAQAPAEGVTKAAESCCACKTGGKLLSCDSCTAAYHLECLDPPLKAFPKSWECLKCAEPLADIEKFLDCQMTPSTGSDNATKKYLVKWKSRSYLHCSWVSQTDLDRASKLIQGLRMKLNHFNKQYESVKSFLDEDQPPIRPEWVTVDRIIGRRKSEDDKDEYLVKWKELGYDEATWETEDDIRSFRPLLAKYEWLMARGPKKAVAKKKFDASKGTKFVALEETPKYLTGGVLHPYQLEGLNFLRYARGQEKHVILADEMGLGKTIQSIAFLASLAEEGIVDPHLVVAPLSTLRNWEREFATWAPHMNTIVYVGSAQARSVIREHEFFYPKSKDKAKKRHFVDKQKRIKFDVLLTSYEMINLDTSVLKPIRWDCLIVDEGHRLKSKDSKLFQTLQGYSSYHRVLLTGTPLQNNLDELFTLMHFLDDSKFSSLEEFQQEFRDINQEEQVARLHKMLSSHLLRRVKKDVLKQLPPKRELMLRVELSPMQKEYYRAILTRNYEVLCRHGGPQISLNNVVMELRKVCGHPYLLEGTEPGDLAEDALDRHRVEASGKLCLLDKMMVKLKAAGHRVLIYSQFQRMLDILEDWLSFKNWSYERIDGSVNGVERQIRIDRFNAPNSSRFCFLLSTRAGGLGINLATADTVVIYDSDWNPHADLQAMARAHRLGQKNMVMIYRLVTRGTIEERMMQMTKKKMVLEHLVVGRMKTQVLNQEELNDILKYGAKELFTDENDDPGKSRQIHYDAVAIDRLLDRSQVGADEMSINEDDNDLLKAFKVANFEYVDEETVRNGEAEAQEDGDAKQLKSPDFWDNLLKDKVDHQKQQASDVQEMGKGKRSRKQVARQEHVDDDLAGMEYVSSEDEDNELEEDYSPPKELEDEGLKRPRKKLKVKSTDPPPLIEGEGKSLKILGFKRKHRALFVQVLMRFGLGDFSWNGFVPHFKQKTPEEIKEYGTLFLTHIAEELTDSPLFSGNELPHVEAITAKGYILDGVPKEGLRIQDVLVRVAVLHLITNKLKQMAESPAADLFSQATYAKFSGLRMLTCWKEEQDGRLLKAIAKHGYGRWLDIVEDPEYGLQSTICEELMLSSDPIARNELTDPTTSLKKVIDFVKRRVSLLERVLNAEYYQNDDPESVATQDSQGGDQECEATFVCGQEPTAAFIPVSYPVRLEAEEISGFGNDPKRSEVAQLYNQMCWLLAENRVDAFQTYIGNKSAGVRLRKCIRQVDLLCCQMRRELGAKAQASSSEEKERVNGQAADAENNVGSDAEFPTSSSCVIID